MHFNFDKALHWKSNVVKEANYSYDCYVTSYVVKSTDFQMHAYIMTRLLWKENAYMLTLIYYLNRVLYA